MEVKKLFSSQVFFFPFQCEVAIQHSPRGCGTHKALHPIYHGVKRKLSSFSRVLGWSMSAHPNPYPLEPQNVILLLNIIFTNMMN